MKKLSPKTNTVTADGGPTSTSTTFKSTAADKSPELHQHDENPVTPERGQMPARQTVSIPRIVPVYHQGRLILIPDCEDRNQGLEIIKKAIGASSLDFVNELLADLADIADRARVTNLQKLNFLLSVVTGISPRDQLESMLATHMGAVHVGIMKAAQSLAKAATPVEAESHGRTLSKLARTFVMQMDTLKRYRSEGQLKLTMQTVTFNVDAQAIARNSTEEITGQSDTSTALPQFSITAPMQMPVMHERDHSSL
jgi:hypothetical protein